MTRRLLPWVLALVSFLPAQDKPQPEPPKEVYPFFRDAETKLILDYYRAGSGHLPPGLERPGSVPAALQRQLKVTGTLPPAGEKLLQPFPSDLDRRLNPVPAGYRRVLLGTAALLLQNTTNLIVDLLDVVRR
jgi:hypothetical protein